MSQPPPPSLQVDYVSPPRTPGWLRRKFPSAVFYSVLFDIVWSASRLAKRGRYDDAAFIASSRRVVRLLESLGARLTVENLGALGRFDGPAVIVGNHMSTLETFSLPGFLLPFRPVTFIVKRQLVEMPIFKHVMISRRPVVVGRASPREDLRTMLDEGEARLRDGMNLVVFPQTTRAATWTPAEFNSIAVKLARRAGVPVAPLAVRSDAWGIGRWSKDFGPIRPELPIRIAFGEAMPVTGNGRDAQEAVVRFITGRMRAWNVPVIDGSAPPAD